MSGLEVLGGISAVIAILDATLKVWEGAQKDLKFMATFEAVANQLPILRATLSTCDEHFQRVLLPADVANTLKKAVKNCEVKAEKLGAIFQETIPGDDDSRYERYCMVARRLGKGSKVEELMTAITKDSQYLVNYHAVKSASPELYTQLEGIMQELKPLESSLPAEETASQNFYTYGGVSYVHTGSGTSNYYGAHADKPTFNFVTNPASSTDFAGSYARSSLKPVPTYVARRELEEKLQAQFPAKEDSRTLGSMRTAVIWGLGGAGKSQLALDYVQNHRQLYKAVFWIQAGQKDTIEKEFRRIYKQICRDSGKDGVTVSVEDAVPSVKTWLQQQELRCLWVMDSADDIEDHESSAFVDLNYYFPEASQLDRILTTRSSRVEDLATQSPICVSEMTPLEAALLFRKSTKIEREDQQTQSEIRAIVKDLGHLALAVTLAGSYVRETPGLSSNLNRFRAEYETNRTRLLSERARPLLHHYGESVLSTWEVSISAIRRRSATAANLMNLLAFLNYDDIFLSLFSGGLDFQSDTGEYGSSQRASPFDGASHQFIPRQSSPPQHEYSFCYAYREVWELLTSSRSATIDYHDIVSAFKMLQAYSLVSWQADQEAYSIHKLVHAWGHDRLEAEERQVWSLTVLELLKRTLHQHQDQMEVELRLVPHVVANFTAILSAHNSSCRIQESDRERLGVVGDLLFRLGRWGVLGEVYLLVWRSSEQDLGREHPSTLTYMLNLAKVLHQQGEYQRAEVLLRQIYQMQVEVLGLTNRDTLETMSSLGVTLLQQSKYDESEEMLRRTLSLRQETLGQDHNDTLNTMNILAMSLCSQGKYEQAEMMSSQALRLCGNLSKEDRITALDSMMGLATTLQMHGKYEQAVSLNNEAFQMRKEILGREHPDTLINMQKQAVCLYQLGKNEQAEATQSEALQLLGKVVGKTHIDTLTGVFNLFHILQAQGRHEQAEKLYQTYHNQQTAAALDALFSNSG